MRCLEAGGLDAVYDKSQDSMNYSAPADYIPNPNGFYQFNGDVTSVFHLQYDGKLIKCPIRDVLKLPVDNYKVILLSRNPAEVRASMAKWIPFQSWGKAEVLTYFQDEYLTALKTKMLERGDMDIIEVQYRDIVNSPLDTFTLIQSNGWPIDPALCADKVDSGLYRNKLEKDK